MRYDVGIGEYKVARTIGDEIKTYALGSCVAVMVYDQKSRVAGLIHIALPEARINEDKAKRLPGYFADSGLPVFIRELQKLGADLKKSSIKIAGGASIMDDKGMFDIGRRNVIAIKRFLWKNGLGVIKEDIGGKISRTVSISVESGKIRVSNASGAWEL